MTLEMFPSTEQHSPESESRETLIEARRIELQLALAAAAVKLNEANTEYNSIISQILEVNQQVRSEGTDTGDLEMHLQRTGEMGYDLLLDESGEAA